MTSREEYIKRFSTRKEGCQYLVYYNGQYETQFSDHEEVLDFIEDQADVYLNEDHDYACEYCNVYSMSDEVRHRIEDATFTAVKGSTIVWGGDFAVVPVCPNCGEDMEECR